MPPNFANCEYSWVHLNFDFFELCQFLAKKLEGLLGGVAVEGWGLLLLGRRHLVASASVPSSALVPAETAVVARPGDDGLRRNVEISLLLVAVIGFSYRNV